jgi:hypothetical protein
LKIREEAAKAFTKRLRFDVPARQWRIKQRKREVEQEDELPECKYEFGYGSGSL